MPATRLDHSRVWVFAVSVTEYRYPELVPLPTISDKQLIMYLVASGVSPERIVFLRDQEATLLRIRAAFTAMLPRARKGDLLLFYFSGHGGEGFFCPYDAGEDRDATRWGIREILTQVDSFFGGDRVILLADTCYSGSLATALKARTVRKKSYSVLASTTSTQPSWGDQLTRSFIAALAGRPELDHDGDGRVTLGDVAEYAAAKIKADRRAQQLTYATFGPPAGELVLASDEPMMNTSALPDFEVEWNGAWYPAEILRKEGNRYLIHYHGWGGEWDEWIGSNRLRKRRQGSQGRRGSQSASVQSAQFVAVNEAEPVEPATAARDTLQQMITGPTKR